VRLSPARSRFRKSARKALRIVGRVLAVLVAVWCILFLLAGACLLPRAYFALSAAVPEAVNVAVGYGAAVWFGLVAVTVGEALCDLARSNETPGFHA
jgi:hypothetical protein